MVRYDVLGFPNESDYADYFFRTLLKTNWTYNYFVDWKKVKENLKQYIKEISLLNSISKISAESRKEELKLIFTEYPETVPVVPLTIALRERNITLLEIGEKAFYKVFDFSRKRMCESDADNLAGFCEKTGVLSLFGEINDLYTYLMGVEVGLDSNARKNRSGEIFQQLLGLLLEKKLKDKNLQIKREDPNVQTARTKRADFVVYKEGKPLIVMECNFYNTTGSKPVETANAYIDFQRKVREKGECSFVWVTDGPAWRRMEKTARQSFREIDFPINYTITDERIERIVGKLL